MRTSIVESPPDLQGGRDIVVRAGATETHTGIIQAAIDKCAAAGGGRVVLTLGDYCAGTIIMRSGVTLHLDKGAILSGTSDVSAYLQKTGQQGARIVGGSATALLFAENADNIAITGQGVLDGNGSVFWEKLETPHPWVEEARRFGKWVPAFDYKAKPRPRALVLFANCSNVRLEGFRIQNSPAWTIHLLACSSVVVRSIVLRGILHGCNTDGLDLDGCSDVLVEDCDIFTGDDAICLKNTNTWGLKRRSHDIIVRRCRLRSTTHGFTVGTETQDDFEDISFTDSQIEQAGEYHTLTGIGLSILDGGAIRRMHIANVSISDAVGAIQIRLGNEGRGQSVKVPGEIRDITLENITIRRAHGNSLIAGLLHHPLQNIILRNISLEFVDFANPANIPAGFPEMESEFPPNTTWRFLPAFGFYCRHVDGLELTNVTILPGAQDDRPALALKNVRSLHCENFDAAEYIRLPGEE